MIDNNSKIHNFTTQPNEINRKMNTSLKRNSDSPLKTLYKFTNFVKFSKNIFKSESQVMFNKNNFEIIAYPESDINELYSIMTNLGIDRIPVAKTPWDKTVVGCIHLNQIKKQLL